MSTKKTPTPAESSSPAESDLVKVTKEFEFVKGHIASLQEMHSANDESIRSLQLQNQGISDELTVAYAKLQVASRHLQEASYPTGPCQPCRPLNY